MLTRVIKIPRSLEDKLKDLKEEGISSLDISPRIVNSLEKHGIKTIGELSNCCFQVPGKCGIEGGLRANCECLKRLKENSEAWRQWIPKAYLREIQGFADVTIERIDKALKKKIAENVT